MKLLLVGDPHVTVDSLAECRALVALINKTAVEHRVDRVVFLGDLYHTHAVVRVEVMNFWHEALRSMEQPAICLVGNHDMPGDGSKVNSLVVHGGDYVEVVEEDFVLNGVGFLPYMADKDALVAKANDLVRVDRIKTLICHQTFDGSVYENGFYAEDGVDSNLINVEAIISGHIHAPQAFGKVWYPGAPRWRTLSDANVSRALWVVTFEDGVVVEKTPIDTSTACRPIRFARVTPSTEECLKDISPDADWRLDIEGPAEFVERIKTEIKGIPHLRFRTMVTDNRVIRIRESDGVDVSFLKFVNEFQPPHGSSPEALTQLAKQRLAV